MCVIGLYFLLEDNMAHCDLYYTAKASDSYFTEIFIAPKPENHGIIGGFEVGESDEKSEKTGWCDFITIFTAHIK